jgi:hypothetical protein
MMVVWGPIINDTVQKGFTGTAALILSRPTFAFIYRINDENGQLLRYVLSYKRSEDTLGTNWLPSLMVAEHSRDVLPEEGEPIDPGNALVVVEGKPALLGAGHGSAGGYIRALDAFGTTWAEQHTPGKSLGTTANVAAGMIAGLPARVEWVNDADLLYSRALDAEALEWSEDILIEQHEIAGNSMRLVEVAGAPAVIYFDETTMDLKYRRATDATGAQWSDPVVLSAQADGRQRVAMVDGRPAVLFDDRITGEVKFIAANDAEGKRWGIPVALPLSNDTSANHLSTPFGAIAGRPAFAFVDVNSDNDPNIRFQLLLLMYR